MIRWSSARARAPPSFRDVLIQLAEQCRTIDGPASRDACGERHGSSPGENSPDLPAALLLSLESSQGTRSRNPLNRVEEARECDSPGSDRKSTRLNSSHVKSSYAVFCL